jgi:uncharacterized protein (TIGR02145 family)
MRNFIIITVAISLSLTVVSCHITTSQSPEFSSFIDERDGQVYKTVKIGNQTWMAENLKFADGNSWYYNNDSINYKNYGRLYNYKSAKNGCPKGWHLSSDNEWKILIDCLGGEADAGGKLKATSGWTIPNTGATNASGFSALASGYYDVNQDTFCHAGISATFWTTPGSGDTTIWYRTIYYDDTTVIRKCPYKPCGFSVRCVKD